MEDKRVTSVIQTYEPHLNSKPYICSTTFGRATLGANGLPNKLIHSCSATHNIGVQFLKDLELIQGITVCCKCGFQMSWCVNTNRKAVTDDDVGVSQLLLHALLPCK